MRSRARPRAVFTAEQRGEAFFFRLLSGALWIKYSIVDLVYTVYASTRTRPTFLFFTTTRVALRWILSRNLDPRFPLQLAIFANLSARARILSPI